MLHTDNGGEFTGTILVTELRRFFPSLRITTGASRKPWVQGCVEQAHNAVYSYLHHLREIHGDTFSWAELLPSVAYMHNTAVQTHKSESPMFQRDGRDNRLVNADKLVTDDVLPEDEYRRRFDAHFGIRPGKQVVASLPVCNGPDNTGDESEEHARCNRSSGKEAETLTRAYDARQERAASDNARAVQRNQKRMNAQTAADEVLFTEGDTVLIRVPQRCRTKLDPANIVGCVRSVHITNVERRYKIATQAGMLNRMLSAADLAKRIDDVTISSEDDYAMQTTVDEISLQHAVRVAIGRAKGHNPVRCRHRGAQGGRLLGGVQHRCKHAVTRTTTATTSITLCIAGTEQSARQCNSAGMRYMQIAASFLGSRTSVCILHNHPLREPPAYK